MISQEEYTAIVSKLAVGDDITNIEGLHLVDVISELDNRAQITEGALQYVIAASKSLFEDLSSSAVKIAGYRDHAKKRTMMKLATDSYTRLLNGVQVFIASAVVDTKSAVADVAEELPKSETPA
jgi:hypothetical protein